MDRSAKRIETEFAGLQREPVDGFEVCQTDNHYKWVVHMTGPTDTPYEGGKFTIEISFPADYPFAPPKCRYITQIYNPMIGRYTGSISLPTLRYRGWSPELRMSDVLSQLRSMLTDVRTAYPVQELSALEPEIARKYKVDSESYNRTAREWVAKYASC